MSAAGRPTETIRVPVGQVTGALVLAGPSAFRYAIAGCDLALDRSLPVLAPFAQNSVETPGAHSRSADSQEPIGDLLRISSPPTTAAASANERCGLERPLQEGIAWLEGEGREVVCALIPEGYRLRIKGVSAFAIAADGGSIRCLDSEPDLSPSPSTATLLGPALVLALALQETFCLHASALSCSAGVVAFVGTSGCGKSTLAAALNARSQGSFQRLADDILPVKVEAGRPLARPRFPQPKFGNRDQPSVGFPEALPLAAIYELSRPGEPALEVGSRLLAPPQAALALVRHTLAARLFDPELLASHFSFCADLAQRVPVRSLAYPWSREAWPEVTSTLLADLATS